MSTTITTIFITFLLHLLLLPPSMARHYPILPSAPSTALPLGSRTRDFVAATTPFSNRKRRPFHPAELKNCMPKGSRRSSAPSRYVNYHTLGSLRCFAAVQPPPH